MPRLWLCSTKFKFWSTSFTGSRARAWQPLQWRQRRCWCVGSAAAFALTERSAPPPPLSSPFPFKNEPPLTPTPTAIAAAAATTFSLGARISLRLGSLSRPHRGPGCRLEPQALRPLALPLLHQRRARRPGEPTRTRPLTAPEQRTSAPTPFDRIRTFSREKGPSSPCIGRRVHILISTAPPFVVVMAAAAAAAAARRRGR